MAAVIDVVLDQDKEYEIVNGQPEEKIMGGALHGIVSVRLIFRLEGLVENQQLGVVCGPDTSFRIGENERIPDVAFVAAARIPAEGVPEGAWPFAPDLAVEIISPNDLYEKVMTKVVEYLDAGVRQVWLIWPERRLVMVHSSLTDVKVLQETGELDGGDMIPGFRCRVADLFLSPVRS
jgi:Uma2 family endonuclease